VRRSTRDVVRHDALRRRLERQAVALPHR
jgi:hypothetical protein